MGVTAPYRVALVSYHPISYHAAFYRAVHNQDGLLETVLYLDKFGVSPEFDPDFQGMVHWDAGVLTGYRYKFFHNLAWKKDGPPSGPFGCVNPGIFFHILFSNYHAVVADYATFSAWIAYAAALIRGIPIILRAEADLFNNRPASMWLKLKNMILPYMVSRASAVLYSCAKNREYFLHYGAREESLFPILSSTDQNQFVNLLEKRNEIKDSMRRAYGIPNDAFIVIFAGRLIPRKRPIDLLQACIQAGAEHTKLWIIFVGDGPLHSSINEMAQERMFQRVIISGFQSGEDLARHYLMGDIFVMPSEWDPTPKALNEAIASGSSCIVSDGVGQAGDLIIDGVSGLVFPVGDVDCLAAHIRRLLVDKRFCHQLAERATEMAKEWTPEKNAEGLLAAMNFIYANR